MSLDGLRAWIGEVERKLGMRTRVFLVLVAIAIGGAGAGIYLALEAEDKGATTEEVRALEERLGEVGGGTAESTAVSTLQTQVNELRTEVEALRNEGTGSSGTGASQKAPEVEASPPGGKKQKNLEREAKEAIKKAERQAQEALGQK